MFFSQEKVNILKVKSKYILEMTIFTKKYSIT